MNSIKHRKYPRTYKKTGHENNRTHNNAPKELVLNMSSAIGIIAFTFINGMLLGYLVKRR